jgi:outer membrane protein assembly factor BamB
MMDMPKLAGEDAASEHLLAPHAEGSGSVVPVLTRGYSSLRSGANTKETVLTPQAIRSNGGLRKHFDILLPGDARGLESEPLIVPSVQTISGTYDVVISSTMGGQVYCHDAQNGDPLWMVRLSNPVKGSKAIDAWAINQNWSILSTGVIVGTMLYVVAWTSPDGSNTKASHWLHGVDIRSGQQPKPPLLLAKVANIQRKQRSSLSFVNGKVLIPWGTIQESNDGAHGFLTAVDVATWKVVDEWNATPNGSGGGIWMAGAAPVVLADGTIILMTGNGDFNPAKQNFGECFVALKLHNDSFTVTDWWSPFRDQDRNLGGGFQDMDLGSGAPAVIPELNLCMGAGKDGVLYPLRLDNFGKPATAGRFDLLYSPPLWATYFPGLGINAAPQNIKDLDRLWANKTRHQHGELITWKSDDGWRLFVGGENSPLRVWSVEKNGKITFLATSNETASPYAPQMGGGMTGVMSTLSSNGTKDGVIWGVFPDGDANKSVTNGRIFAFDGQNYKDAVLQRLWMSDEKPDGHSSFNKFGRPVISGGRLYWPHYDARISVWSL